MNNETTKSLDLPTPSISHGTPWRRLRPCPHTRASMSHTRARPLAITKLVEITYSRVCVRECTRPRDDCRPPGQLDGSSGVLAVNYAGYQTSRGDDSPINGIIVHDSWNRDPVICRASDPRFASSLPLAGSGFVPGKDPVAVSAFRRNARRIERKVIGGERRRRERRRRPEEELVISGGVGGITVVLCILIWVL